MSEQIFSQFHENKIPKTWLSPVINIRLSDWTLLVNAWNMVEVWGGWYVYDYVDYDKKKTYLIDVDWWSATLDDRAQNVSNILDAYPNKKDWKGWGGWTITNNIDTTKLAQDVWKVKTDVLEKQNWTVWKYITELDTKEVLKAIDNLEIPNNEKELKEISDKSETIINGQSEIKWTIEKQWEIIGDTVSKIKDSVVEAKSDIYTHQEKISQQIDWVWIAINKLPTFDYKRIEDFFINNFSNLPVLLQINELKEELKEDIKKWNKSDMKEFILKSLENQMIYEKQLIDNELQKEFQNSLNTINDNIETLNKKEIDFSPIYKELIWISKSIEEWQKQLSNLDNETKERMEEQYRKSMKYVIYIAKNIWTINKNDLIEIKNILSLMKK
jgi:hypothetical protein